MPKCLLLATPLALAIALPAPTSADDVSMPKANVEAGAELYENYCSTCHGMQLQNSTGVTFDLRRLGADEHTRFVNSVLNGKNAMPAWRGVLKTEQIESLWAYIRANANR